MPVDMLQELRGKPIERELELWRSFARQLPPVYWLNINITAFQVAADDR